MCLQVAKEAEVEVNFVKNFFYRYFFRKNEHPFIFYFLYVTLVLY